MDLAALEQKSQQLRLQILQIADKKRMGHLGGTFSCVDLLVALYYGNILRIDSQNPQWQERDRFILSKGHACLALYPILIDLGFMHQDINTYCEDGGLGAQLDVGMSGVDWNTGSLGHALGVCCGLALAAKLDNSNRRAYTVLGDAECAEGSIWEAIAFAGEHKLANLVGIIDRNRLSVTEVLDDDSFFKAYPALLESLDWTCLVIDGHSFFAIMSALRMAIASSKPTMILANTIKGKGVSFMENKIKWHHAMPSTEEISQAKKELMR